MRNSKWIHPNTAGNQRFGRRWCRREIRLWESNHPRKSRERYEQAMSLLVTEAFNGKQHEIP